MGQSKRESTQWVRQKRTLFFIPRKIVETASQVGIETPFFFWENAPPIFIGQHILPHFIPQSSTVDRKLSHHVKNSGKFIALLSRSNPLPPTSIFHSPRNQFSSFRKYFPGSYEKYLSRKDTADDNPNKFCYRFQMQRQELHDLLP